MYLPYHTTFLFLVTAELLATGPYALSVEDWAPVSEGGVPHVKVWTPNLGNQGC